MDVAKHTARQTGRQDGGSGGNNDVCNSARPHKNSHTPSGIIGHGTWLDKLAYELVRREESLRRDTSLIVVESGLGASGIPHIGSLGDAVRAYGVKLALGNLGYDSKLIAYSDDLDGLRKVPDGMPNSLEDHLAKPVSLIPDPYSCHDSYGMHMSSILLDGLDRVGVQYEFRRGYDTYRRGMLRDQIDIILKHSSKIGTKIAEMVGQSKYQESLPYFPVCASCNRLYTARAVEYVASEKKVTYECHDTHMNKALIKGCGYAGESDITSDLGKLAWKVEFAARWAAFDVRFEAYGKDIMDSVKVNDWVAEHILGYAPPHHAKYEMFLDKGGKKISKSAGNVLTAQRWLEFGTSQSILLLLYKRITGARELDIIDDVPALMDEFDDLESTYFESLSNKEITRKELRDNPARLAKATGLYLYANLLNPPEHPRVHVSYALAAKLAGMYKTDRQRRVTAKLIEYGVVSESSPAVDALIKLAGRYADEFSDMTETSDFSASSDADGICLDETARGALSEIVQLLDSASLPDEIQTGIYGIAKSKGMAPKDVFAILYMILIGSSRGPRIGPLICDMGPAHAAQLIRERMR